MQITLNLVVPIFVKLIICIDNWESPTIPRILINITCINKNFGGGGVWVKVNFIKCENDD